MSDKLRIKLIFENDDNPEALSELIFARWPQVGDLVDTAKYRYEVVGFNHWPAYTGADEPHALVRLQVLEEHE